MRRYKKNMLCGGIILFCLSEGIGLSWGQVPEGVTQSSFWENSTTLALLAWAGTIASGIGLIASVCAAVKAKNSEEAAIEAKNSTKKVITYLDDIQYSAEIDVLLEKITYLEMLCRDSDNYALIIYIIGEISKHIKRTQEKINEDDVEIRMSLRTVYVIFQDLNKLSEIDKNKMLTKMCDAKNELITCSEKIRKNVGEKINE